MEKEIIVFGAKYLIYIIIAVFFGWAFVQQKQKQKQILLMSLLILPLSFLLAKIAGYFYFNPRPFVVGNFTPLIPHVADNGFPSDHTLLSVALAAIAYYFNKTIGITLFVVAVIVGISRVAAGVHHTVDVLGSIFIVMIASLFIFIFFPKLLKSDFIKQSK